MNRACRCRGWRCAAAREIRCSSGPPLPMYLDVLPLVLLTYVITFGDWVTAEAVIREV